MTETLFISLIVAGCFSGAGLSAYFLRWAGHGRVVGILAATLAVLFGVLWLFAFMAAGWGGLIYIVFAVIGVAPAFVGLVVGALFGRKRPGPLPVS